MMKNLFITAMCICLMTLAGCNKAAADTEFLDPKATNVIVKMYPDARIIDVDYEGSRIAVEIVHENRGKDVYLNRGFDWIRTEWDVRRSELPAAVTDRLATEWPSWKIEDAEYVETPSGSWYKIEIEQGDNELDVRITPDGTVLR